MADYSDYKECTDCVHYELCLHQEKFLIEHNRKDLIRRYGFGLSEPEICCNFRDRSRFVELSYAEWVEDEDMYGDPIYHCSNCNEHFVLEEGTPIENHYFYCPNCGAKMDEQALREREENA